MAARICCRPPAVVWARDWLRIGIGDELAPVSIDINSSVSINNLFGIMHL